MPLKKLSEIEEKLNKDYLNIKNRYVRLKRCKYILLILKTVLISLSIGLSFINPLMLEFHKGAFWALYFSYSMSMTLSVVQKRQLNSYCLRTIQTYLYMLQHLKNYTAKQTKYFGD